MGVLAGACDEAELAFLGFVDAVVVGDPCAYLEAESRDLPFDVVVDVVPWLVDLFEDVAVGEVLGHLLLVPALADEEHAMRSTVVMQED